LALVISNQYKGICSVLETFYGGFSSTFGNGGTRDPPTTPQRVTKDLRLVWEIRRISMKPYTSIAATHGTINYIRMIRERCPDAIEDISAIAEIVIEMSEPALKKG
jgi:aconitate decarboxylase